MDLKRLRHDRKLILITFFHLTKLFFNHFKTISAYNRLEFLTCQYESHLPVKSAPSTLIEMFLTLYC